MARGMTRVQPFPRAALSAPLIACVLLCACAGSTDYPSLAPRDVERVEGSATPTAGNPDAIPVLPPASADLTTRIDGLLAAARKAHANFTAKQSGAERAIAGAGAVASPGWTTAEIALSDLQAARSGAVTALAELDHLYVDARAANPEQVSPSAAAIGAARDQVDGWVASEDAVIARLGSRLKG